MTNSVVLKRMRYQSSPDGQWSKILFDDQHGQSVAIELPSSELRGVIADMIQYNTLLMTDEALSPDADATTADPAVLQATESSLMIAKAADVVRWEAGGALVRMTTVDGMALHIALSKDLQAHIVESLSKALPEAGQQG